MRQFLLHLCWSIPLSIWLVLLGFSFVESVLIAFTSGLVVGIWLAATGRNPF